MPTPLVIGNWKMHGSRVDNDRLLARLLPQLCSLDGVDTAVCPPYPYLDSVGARLQGQPTALGAQNLAIELQGAFTGEVSALMLRDLGCRYVLLGHSERRSLYHESDEVVARKFALAREASLTPVLCIGETLDERERGETAAIVARQIDAVLTNQGIKAFDGAVIAYEPVWAIGTGLSATPEQAQDVHAAIRKQLCDADAALGRTVPLLYGGSVKPDNAAALMAQPDIDGALVGGASLDADAFAAICRAAEPGA